MPTIAISWPVSAAVRSGSVMGSRQPDTRPRARRWDIRRALPTAALLRHAPRGLARGCPTDGRRCHRAEPAPGPTPGSWKAATVGLLSRSVMCTSRGSVGAIGPTPAPAAASRRPGRRSCRAHRSAQRGARPARRPRRYGRAPTLAARSPCRWRRPPSGAGSARRSTLPFAVSGSLASYECRRHHVVRQDDSKRCAQLVGDGNRLFSGTT